MTIYQFMLNSPWLTFFMVLVAANTIGAVVNRVLRHWNIRKYGYPPPHCDADGDFKEENIDNR